MNFFFLWQQVLQVSFWGNNHTHHYLFKQHNTSAPRLRMELPMVPFCQHHLVEPTALPTPAMQFCSIRVAWTGASLDPLPLPLPMPPRMGTWSTGLDSTKAHLKDGFTIQVPPITLLHDERAAFGVNILLLRLLSWQGRSLELQMLSPCPCEESLPENDANPETCKAEIGRG